MPGLPGECEILHHVLNHFHTTEVPFLRLTLDRFKKGDGPNHSVLEVLKAPLNSHDPHIFVDAIEANKLAFQVKLIDSTYSMSACLALASL